MNSITINHKHRYGKNEAWMKAENMLESLAQKYGLKVEHDGESEIAFSGSGIKGKVTIHHNQINFSATLSFLMIAMKSVIISEIKNKLCENFD